MRKLFIGIAVLTLHGCGGDAGHPLRVDLVTDFMPAIEFDAVRVSIGEGDGRQTIDHIVDPAGDYVRGIVLGAAQVPLSEQSIEVSLFQDGALVIGRQVTVLVRTPVVATVVITRDCRGVMCPGSGDPLLTSCLGGQCANPRCTLETPEFCPTGECVRADECPSHVCASALCTTGVCLFDPDDARCGAGQRCDITLDCVDEGVDAGMADARLSDVSSDTFDAGPELPDVAESDDASDVFDAGPAPGCPRVDEDTVFLYDFESDEDAVANVEGTLRDDAIRMPGSSPCGGSILSTPGPAQSRFVVPDQPVFHLAEGSFDFWVRIPSTAAGSIVGLFSRDAIGSDEAGHVTLYLSQEGRLALRGQMGADNEVALCSDASSIPHSVWHRIGVNDGPEGLDFYLNGVRQTMPGTAAIFDPPLDCAATSIPFSLTDTTNPFVLGAGSDWSANGSDVPARLSGSGWSYDHFRLSRIRRDYAAEL